MKRFSLIIAAMFTILTSVSCVQNGKSPKILILYYSQTGHTQLLAREFQARLNADMAEIKVTAPYDGSFEETIERCLKEREEGTLPELLPLGVKPEDYDIIFLGYPIWFGTYAPPVAALLEQVSFAGKKVVPFCTFGSGGLDSSIRDLAGKQAEATILPGYGVRAARLDAIPAEVDRFLKENAFLEGEYVKLDPFPEAHVASEEEAAIFDAAVSGYGMIDAKAKATRVASRVVPGGVEYLFTAEPRPREDAFPAGPGQMKVYVLAEDGKAPVFTQVIRP